jgi:3-keto-5-aminohexanoate cleavage enzyme
MADDSVIIEVALHELVDKASNPNVPYGADEVAVDGLACLREGMTLLHFHARDPRTGEQLWHDDGTYAKAIGEIRELGAPADLPWYPTYPGVRPGLPVAESMRHVAALTPSPVGLRLAAIDVGSSNLSAYNPTTKEFLNAESVKVLPHALFEEFSQFCGNHGLRPYLGVYEPGHLRHIAAYLDKAWIEPPLAIKFFFSELHPYGLPPAAHSVEIYAGLLDVVLPGVEVAWFVQCYGKRIWDLARPSLDLGGHVRVGIGDYHPWDWPDTTGEQPTNAELVTRAVELAGVAGRPIATVADARRILGLT